MRSIRYAEVRGWRLRRSGLARGAAEASADPGGIVGRIGGVQAQVLTAAEHAIGARVPGATRVGVEAALWDERTLVKTYGPRGTLHLLPAAELPLWMAALRRAHDVRLDDLDELTLAIGDALGDRTLTREELAEEVGRRIGRAARETLSSTWGTGLFRAATAGLLCFARGVGARVAFARADRWVDGWSAPDEEESLRELVRRYARAYGPFTPAGFGRWLLLGKEAARDVVESVAEEMVEVQVEGRTARVLAEDAEGPWEEQPDSLVLVPQYDVYVLNGWPREAVLSESARARVSSVGRGRFEGAVALNLLLVGGEVAGIWRREERRGRLEVRVEPFVRLTKERRRKLEAEAARVGAFFGREADLATGPISG